MVAGQFDLNESAYSLQIIGNNLTISVIQTAGSGKVMYPYLFTVYGLGAGK